MTARPLPPHPPVTEITAAEAAARLGVKLETLYAYVSRGQLGSRRGASGRGSVFDAAEVAALAARTRKGGRAGALEVVVASAITSLEGDELRYRGRDAVALAGSAPFEAVADWLWSGDPEVLEGRRRWPAQPATAGAGTAGKGPRRAEAGDPGAGGAAVAGDVFAVGADPINRMRVAVAVVAAADALRYDLEPPAVAAAGRRAITAMAAALPAHRRPPGGSVAARLWVGLTPLRPTPDHVAALDAALVLLADHELAVSTLAARVAASARADPYSVVSTGLGVMAGGLHGGAGRQVVALLEEVGTPARAPAVLGERMRRGERLPGLGHKVYRERDPRAEAMLARLAALPLLPGRWPVVEAVLALIASRVDALVNVDFALGALAWCSGMAGEATEAVFSVARTAGWLAHAIEEYGEEPLRFRPRAAYTGPR